VSLSAVIFDLGRVLLDWVPERAFAQEMDADDVAAFIERSGFHDWNRRADRHTWEQIEAEWCAALPQEADAIRAYRRHHLHSIPGYIPGTLALIAELQQHCIKVGALSNWSADTFADTRQHFAALDRFDTLVISGVEGIAKPDPAIFTLACERLGVEPAAAVFVDDLAVNVAAAEAAGLRGLQFTDAAQLRADLLALGLPVPGQPHEVPIYHLTRRDVWEQALRDGAYRWSTHDEPFDHAGFVHFSFADQVPGIRDTFFAGFADDELVLLRLDPQDALPVLIEDGYPHLYAPLPIDQMVTVPV
jgi:2-haloacid dehalogenase